MLLERTLKSVCNQTSDRFRLIIFCSQIGVNEMTHSMHIWKEDLIETDGLVTVNITIEKPNKNKIQNWYRLPTQYSTWLTSSMDPFTVRVLFLAMKEKANLYVHGEVSPSLLKNLEEFQQIWQCWQPKRYKKIDIIADTEKEQPLLDDSAGDIVAFSGGVDSCFTAFRHATNKCGRLNRDLKTAVMIHGFDIPLDKKDIFDWSFENSKKMLDSLGIELIPLTTSFQNSNLDPHDYFATAAASCLMLFQGKFRAGLLASTEPYQALVTPWGTHPLTDPLLSSNSFEFIHDGADFTRTEKTAELANWPEALSRLRVCWYGPQNDPENRGRNCGRCEKCIRTILNFRVAGIDLPECFEQDVSETQIRSLRRLNKTQINEFEQILMIAEQKSISDSWVDALKFCIFKNKLEASLRQMWHPVNNRIRQLLKPTFRRL